MFIKNLLIASFVAGSAVSSYAQDAPPVKVELRLLAFSTELQEQECYAQDPTAPPTTPSVAAPIRTYLNHQFSTVPLKSGKVVFTTKPDRGSLTREGETLLESTLPAGVKSAILLVVPGIPGDKVKYRALVIDDSKKAFPAGSYHATNMTNLPVQLILEKKNYDFPPGKVQIIENPPVHEGNVSSMRTKVFKNNAWTDAATGLWPRPVQTRGVFIFYQDPTSGNVQLRAFDDITPRSPKPETAAATQ